MKRLFWLAALAFAMVGCARTQKLVIQTDPAGAEVMIIKRGVLKMPGVGDAPVEPVEFDKFEDPPVVLGVAPIEHEFEIERRTHVPGAYRPSINEYDEVIIRARKNGQVAEERVKLNGKKLEILLKLAPPAPGSS